MAATVSNKRHGSYSVIYLCLRLITCWNSLLLWLWTQLLFFSIYLRCISTKPIEDYFVKSTSCPLGYGHALFKMFRLSSAIKDIVSLVLFKSWVRNLIFLIFRNVELVFHPNVFALLCTCFSLNHLLKLKYLTYLYIDFLLFLPEMYFKIEIKYPFDLLVFFAK